MWQGSRSAARLLGVWGLGLLVFASGCEGCDEGPECTDETCSGHGTCHVEDGETVCTCDEGYAGDACDECAAGYQDNDGDGECAPDCTTADLGCGEDAHCDDSSGEAECVCDSGYQDNDGDGDCAPDCDTAALECGEGAHCDDSSGEALCVCDSGYQDNDGDGYCAPTCETAGLDCGELGCDDSSGTARCICPEGYQDNDGNGSCTPDCDTAGLDCHGRGACDDSSGTARCACEEEYFRSDCSVCRSAYYQDNDGDGVCTPTCYFSAESFTCGEHQECSHASGSLECVCENGYQDNDGDGSCLATCQTAQRDETSPLVCPDPNGLCDDGDGVATCRCRTGYADDGTVVGDDCLACASGYQDNDGDGVCRRDCATAAAGGLTCALGCDDSSGVARCICVAGEQDNDGDGTCEADCATAALGCDAAASLVCDDSSGHALCVCESGTYDDGMGTCRAVGGGDGDECVDAIELDPTAPVLYADTTGVGSDYDFSCDTRDRTFDDVFYHLHLEAGESRHMIFTVERVDATGVSVTPVVALLEGDSCATATEIGCAIGGFDWSTGVRTEASLEATLDGGASGADYYIVIGIYDRRGSSRRAIVTVDHLCAEGLVYSSAVDSCIDDPCVDPNPCSAAHRSRCVLDLTEAVPTYECACDMGYFEDAPGSCAPNPSAEGDGCADVTPLDISAGEGTVRGSTADATSAGEGSCGGDQPAKDRVLGFVLDRRARMTLHLSCDPSYDCLLHLRTDCDDAESEVACSDTGAEGDPETMTATLDPGAYYIFVDGWNSRADESLSNGDFMLEYSFHSDPCGDEEAACPGEPVCAAAADWSEFACACETSGEVYFDGSCVDDPCDPDPCEGLEHRVCEADLAAGTSECVCGGIYVSDGAGDCGLAADAEWTILWYLAADNNLYAQNQHEIDDIMNAALSPDVRVVALIDRFDESQGYYAEFGPGSVDVVEELGNPDTGDWTTLLDFGVWAVESYPANHYALVISDHGGAWRGEGPSSGAPSPALRAICWDDRSATPDDGIGISNGQLADALDGITDAAGGPLDLVIYDACLMGEWEVANATAPYADFMLAAPDSSYGFMVRNGAWRDWLDTIVAGAETLSPLAVGEAFVDNYRATMETDPQYVTTVSLTDLATVPDLNDAVSDFADALVTSESEDFYAMVDEVRLAAQHTHYNELVDLKDFARLVAASGSASSEVVSAADALGAALDWSIVYGFTNIDLEGWSPHYGSVGLAGHNGLTVYLPGRYYEMAPEYVDTGAVWSARASWDEFLATYLTGGYSACSGPDPVLDYMPDEVPRDTVTLTECCQSRFLVQTFRAPGTELHGVQMAVLKLASDGAEHQGFFFAIYRPDHGIVWGPAHWPVERSDDAQFFCLARMGLPTEPGEELQILLGGGDPYGQGTTGFATPIRWPIEYAASAGADPPYAEGEARVMDASGEQTIGAFNGDGVEGTFWFEVY